MRRRQEERSGEYGNLSYYLRGAIKLIEHRMPRNVYGDAMVDETIPLLKVSIADIGTIDDELVRNVELCDTIRLKVWMISSSSCVATDNKCRNLLNLLRGK